MKNVKMILMFVLLVGLVFSLAACGGKDQPEESNNTAPTEENSSSEEKTTEPETKETVTITFSQGNDQSEATKKLIEAFEALHPHIKIKLREMPNNSNQQRDQYVTMLSAESSEIDVINLDVIWPAEFAESGYLLPLDRFIERDAIDLSNYIQGGIDAGRYTGRQWALPRYMNSGLLYYRSDIVDSDSVPKTWDELIAKAEELKGTEGTEFGYLMQALQYEGLTANFVEFIGSYGGQILDEGGNVVINSPEALKGLTKMVEVANSSFVPDNILTFREPETLTAFSQGQSVFARHWPAMLALSQGDDSKVLGNVEIAPLPAGDVRSAATLGGWLAGINKYTEHPEEAWEFLQFLVGPEAQKIMAVYATQTPTYLSLFDDSEVQVASPLFASREFVQGLSQAIPRPASPQYAHLSDIVQIEVSKALTKELTPQQALENIEKKLKEILN